MDVKSRKCSREDGVPLRAEAKGQVEVSSSPLLGKVYSSIGISIFKGYLDLQCKFQLHSIKKSCKNYLFGAKIEILKAHNYSSRNVCTMPNILMVSNISVFGII